MKVIIALLSLLLPISAFSQDSTSFYVEFDKDKHALRPEYQVELKNFIHSLSSKKILRWELTGHTDSDGSERYNLSLSERRVNTILEYLKHQGIKEPIDHHYYGESQPKQENDSKEGMQRNRRVEITVFYETPPLTPLVQIEDMEPIDCIEDTTILLPGGTQFSMNKCEYLENQQCIKISDYTSSESAAAQRIHTEDTEGSPLISAGMVQFDLCDGLSIDICIPVSTRCPQDNMFLWDQQEDGSWKRVSNTTIEPVIRNDIECYPMTISGSGGKNMDKPAPKRKLKIFPRPPKVKLKVKKGIYLDEATIYCDCPFTGNREVYKNRRRRKIVIKTSCCAEPFVQVFGRSATGQEIAIEYQPLAQLEEANFMGKCPTDERWRWWIFKTRNKTFYRKYKLKPTDFTPAISPAKHLN